QGSTLLETISFESVQFAEQTEGGTSHISAAQEDRNADSTRLCQERKPDRRRVDMNSLRMLTLTVFIALIVRSGDRELTDRRSKTRGLRSGSVLWFSTLV